MYNSFTNWLIWRRPACPTAEIIRFSEVSAQFDRAGYNALFQRELQRLMNEFPGEAEQLASSLSMDWVGYIARSLRNAGFNDHDIDPLAHEIVIRLLVSPGGLFRDWDRQPIEARFKVAVKNSILNLVQKQRTRQRRIPAVSISHEFEPGQAAQDQLAARSDVPLDSDAIEAFRKLVRNRLGDAAIAILDLRLNGGDLRSAIHNPDFGNPSSYRVKVIVHGIKKLAEEFAQERGDEGFVRQVRRAMAGSNEVVERRVAGNQARRRAVGSLVGKEIGTEEKPVQVH